MDKHIKAKTIKGYTEQGFIGSLWRYRYTYKHKRIHKDLRITKNRSKEEAKEELEEYIENFWKGKIFRV